MEKKRYRPTVKTTIDRQTKDWLERQVEPIGRVIDQLVADARSTAETQKQPPVTDGETEKQ